MNVKEFLEQWPDDTIGRKLACRYIGEGGPWPEQRIKELGDMDECIELGRDKAWRALIAVALAVLVATLNAAVFGVFVVNYNFPTSTIWQAALTVVIVVPYVLWEVKLSPLARKWRPLVDVRQEEYRLFNTMLNNLYDILYLGIGQEYSIYKDANNEYSRRGAIAKPYFTGQYSSIHFFSHFVECCTEWQVTYAFKRLKLEYEAITSAKARRLLKNIKYGWGVAVDQNDKYKLERLTFLAQVFAIPALTIDQAFSRGKTTFSEHIANVGDYCI